MKEVAFMLTSLLQGAVVYGFERAVDLRKATRALAHFEAWLELGASGDEGRPLLEVIEGYNRDDCVSTLKLREWLETLRPDVPRPTAPEAEPPETLTEKLEAVRGLMARLMAVVPEAAEERPPEQRGPWLLAQLLEYHRREDKSMWWRYFNWVEMNDEELIADGSALGGLEYVGVVGEVKQSLVHRYRFPAQDHQLALRNQAAIPEPLNVCAMGKSVTEARDRAYQAVDRIKWPEGLCRRDIAWHAVEQEKG